MITITEATADDFGTIQDIAYKTWPVVYGEILSTAQLQYMLEAFYSVETLRDNTVNKGHHFILGSEGDLCLGFASFQHHYLGQKVTRLHKIYLLPEAQGKGAGKLLVDAVANYAKLNGSTVISLNVNRFNSALSFYEKLGFEIVGEEDIVLEHGYLMEDYMMEKQLR
ncbi:GNAT family N-acetyltransferase [Flavobacterium hiemivividum]|uniref:GNAT family N-acetyltransferase n=1 Tax=Flavobacterium hiemivividum TaxID=2541734 RepID=A0A4R5CWT5_9FLAO|nr:GNAT family N-acetyltransferase [Flavobacterium hiemivividum]TDE03511.1 GNAT family N-acetyltransferase [Flavobacterium hiemivividum]